MYRTLTILLAALFLFGATVQYNDPDPVRWIAIYLAAAAVFLLAAFHRLPWLSAALVAAVALVWAMTLALSAFPNVRIAQLFESWEMQNEAIEQAREMYGLLVKSSSLRAFLRSGAGENARREASHVKNDKKATINGRV